MKTIFTFFALILAGSIMAQIPIGIRTISPKEDKIPLGQFYNIRDKSFDHTIHYTALKDKTDAVLENILSTYDYSIEEGTEDEAGDLYWTIDNGNGFNSTIYRIVNGNYVDLQIVTFENAYLDVKE
jgi:hypothetical protein